MENQREGRDAEILRRWAEGQSSNAIAADMGVTRGVVMGVASRAGAKRSNAAGVNVATGKQRSNARPQINRSRPSGAPAGPPTLPDGHAAENQPIVANQLGEDFLAAYEDPRGIVSLRYGECRGMPTLTTYCKAPVIEDKSYCPACFAGLTIPSRPRTRQKNALRHLSQNGGLSR